MRFTFFIVLFFVFVSSLKAQCLWIKVANTFNYECTSGNPIGGRIGMDSVVHIGTG